MRFLYDRQFPVSHINIYLLQVKEEDETDDKTVNEAMNGTVTGQEKPKMKLVEPATPGNSPARGATSGTRPYQSPRPAASSYGMKHSDSSFGLHSPDSLNDDVQVTNKIFSFQSFNEKTFPLLKSVNYL